MKGGRKGRGVEGGRCERNRGERLRAPNRRRGLPRHLETGKDGAGERKETKPRHAGRKGKDGSEEGLCTRDEIRWIDAL